MAGCITAGVTRSCTTAISGGVNFLYITDTSKIDTVTVGVGGDVTAIVMDVGEVFFKFEFAPNTAAFTETMTNENCATQVTQQLVAIFRGRNQDYRDSIMELADCCCGMTVIHGENTGLAWIWGYTETEEVFLIGNEGVSGTAKSDPNQETITLQALATSKARVFTPGEAGVPV